MLTSSSGITAMIRRPNSTSIAATVSTRDDVPTAEMLPDLVITDLAVRVVRPPARLRQVVLGERIE